MSTLPPLSGLDGERVARALLETVQRVCAEWAEALPFLTGPPERVELSLFAIKNTRRKMEDKHALCVDVNSLFGFKVQFEERDGVFLSAREVY